MKKLALLSLYIALSVSHYAQAAGLRGASGASTVEGASLGEIADRGKSGMKTAYSIMSLVCVLIGFALFATSVIRLIKITRGEIPNAKPITAFAGMIFAAMLASVGVWLFSISNTLQGAFTK